MTTPRISIDVEAEVWLDQFEEKDIVKYLEDEGYTMTKTPEDSFQLRRLAELKRNQPEKFDRAFADYIYETVGMIL
jgi:hypothetical protein